MPWSPLNISGISGYMDARLGVTVDGSNRITELIEQVLDVSMTTYYDGEGQTAGGTDDWRPHLEANAFGVLPGIRAAPDFPFSPVRSQYLRLSTHERTSNLGLSFFWVSRHTAVRNVANHPENCPLTVISQCSIDIFNACGFGNLGGLAWSFPGAGWEIRTIGSGYNDDVPRLYGMTLANDGTLKAYVNGVLIGTETGITWADPYMGWAGICTGYNVSNAEYPMSYKYGDDGFRGLVGFIVASFGLMSVGDMASLYSWAQTEGWLGEVAPAPRGKVIMRKSS